eukprot:TRINITY_DN3860_c0_g1_i3.p1 TRINITY_DN3860_c0_g1~~TRINITY_DN3860_c0_g1_i3.p1  ORF type:complete len:430 (+),score=108.31 TRINITY_DN3860_c0_g1_i3:392-1681(+)
MVHKLQQPPQHDSMAFPVWPDVIRMFVGTLRHTGFKGRIVFFVHPKMLSDRPPHNLHTMKEYLLSKGVELLPVEATTCQLPFKPVDIHQEIRKLCAGEYTMLQLEWARFALARDWLKKNPDTGWALITDVRDTYFQRSPFEDFGPPNGDQAYVYEEFYGEPGKTIATGKVVGIDTTHWFAKMITKCYGEPVYKAYYGKPMLCSGQLIGTHSGLLKTLDEYITEMMGNTQKNPSCIPPELPDQTLMNYMVYHKKLTLEPVPYGKGAVMTLGGACTSNTGKKGLSEHLDFDKDGFILMADGKRAPIVHQWDRCGNWMELWLRRHTAAIGDLPMSKRWEVLADAITAGKVTERTFSTPSTQSEKSGWRECAIENGKCLCSTIVRFGNERTDKWQQVDLAGIEKEVDCLNINAGGPFEDPAPGVLKVCQCKRK